MADPGQPGCEAEFNHMTRNRERGDDAWQILRDFAGFVLLRLRPRRPGGQPTHEAVVDRPSPHPESAILGKNMRVGV